MMAQWTAGCRLAIYRRHYARPPRRTLLRRRWTRLADRLAGARHHNHSAMALRWGIDAYYGSFRPTGWALTADDGSVFRHPPAAVFVRLPATCLAHPDAEHDRLLTNAVLRRSSGCQLELIQCGSSLMLDAARGDGVGVTSTRNSPL